jgi:hypothetical protein
MLNHLLSWRREESCVFRQKMHHNISPGVKGRHVFVSCMTTYHFSSQHKFLGKVRETQFRRGMEKDNSE